MKSLWQLLKETFHHWLSHRPARLGAALSYYALFSLAPLLIILIGIVSIFFSREIVAENVLGFLGTAIGPGTKEFVGAAIAASGTTSSSVIAGVLGIIFLLFGSMGAFRELHSALDELWEQPPRKDPRKELRGVKKFFALLKEKAIVYSLIPVLGLLLLSSVSASVILAAIKNSGVFLEESLILFLEPIVSFIFTTLFFASIYRLLPNVKLPAKEILFGAIITAFLFLLGEFLISFYLTHVTNTNAYGAAGSLIAILVWVFYSAQIFFIGASFTYTYSKRFGYLQKNDPGDSRVSSSRLKNI